MMRAWTVESGGLDATLGIGRAIGSVLACGDVVGLVGELGAGKTHLTKGLALGLGVDDARSVNSPTFVIINEYAGQRSEGPLAVFHIDAYRLGSVAALAALGFEELRAGRGVIVVEWADRVVEALDGSVLMIELTTTGATSRRLALRTADAAMAARLDQAGLDRWAGGGDKAERTSSQKTE